MIFPKNFSRESILSSCLSSSYLRYSKLFLYSVASDVDSWLDLVFASYLSFPPNETNAVDLLLFSYSKKDPSRESCSRNERSGKKNRDEDKKKRLPSLMAEGDENNKVCV